MVCVVTLPMDPVDSKNFALAASLGNSEISTASYFPMVKYQAWIFPPAASAAFLALSSRAGLSLIFAAPLLRVMDQRNVMSRFLFPPN